MIAKANFIFVLLAASLLLSCNGQTTSGTKNISAKDSIVGGPFENREFMYIGMPENIGSVDTSAGWTQQGQKLLITGTIYKLDGKTPAHGVILYYYHTDVNGVYANKRGLDPRVVKHGYIRGWVKSDEKGKYAIYTVRPGSYPSRDVEAHIHPSIKEPGIDKEYYIDEFVFDDDILLTGKKRKKLPNRGGSGILRPLIQGDLQIAEHNIILGLNIPHYPGTVQPAIQSGLSIGEDQPSFTPFHAFGPDKGSTACPVCKYGRYHGIIYFAGNDPDWQAIKKWLTFFEQQSMTRKKYLKVYFVYGNSRGYNKEQRKAELEKLGMELNLQKTALTFVPSFTDTVSDAYLNKINPAVENTIIIYRNRTIIDKFINLKPTAENFSLLTQQLDTNKGAYFDLQEAGPKNWE